MAVRICDEKLIYYIEKRDLTINKLNEIFQYNKNINVCLIDENKRYQGFLTYYTLREYGSIEGAIVKEYVELDSGVWENAYDYLKTGRTKYIPILDSLHTCLCFAYDDESLNKVLRYVKKLQKCKSYLQDMVNWQEWHGVNLIGLNEITYEIFLLLRDIDSRINLIGDAWKNLFLEKAEDFSEEYRCLRAEDDCPAVLKYDFIYKWYDMCQPYVAIHKYDLVKLKERKVIVDCTLKNVEKICNVLLHMKLDVIGLHIEGTDRKFIWDYPVLEYESCLSLCRIDAVLIAEKESRLFEKLLYEGRMLGTDIIFFPDIKKLENIQIDVLLENRKIGLVGDICLCRILYKYFVKGLGLDKKNIFFLNILSEKLEDSDLGDLQKYVPKSNIYDKNIHFFIVEKSTMKDYGVDSRVSIIRERMKEAGINNVSNYYLDNFEFLNDIIKQEYYNQTFVKGVSIVDVKKVIVGCSKSYSGNFFICELLDGHPKAVSIPHSYFHNLLWYYSLNLFAMCEAKDMMSHLQRLYLNDLKEVGQEREFIDLFPDWSKFSEGFLEILHAKKNISMYTIFVALHLAYYYMRHKCYANEDDLWIYWEPHRIREKEKVLFMFDWFREHFEDFILLKIVRDPIRSLGSSIRDLITCNLIQYVSISRWAEEEDYFCKYEENLCVIRFEDIKLKPEKVMRFLCHRIKSVWDDSLMHTTRNGKSMEFNNGEYIVKDFDLRPVYNRYTEYFTEFDYHRLKILFRKIRFAYGYDTDEYCEIDNDQLWEWIQVPFKFENLALCNKAWDSDKIRKIISASCCAAFSSYYNNVWDFYDYVKF